MFQEQLGSTIEFGYYCSTYEPSYEKLSRVFEESQGTAGLSDQCSESGGAKARSANGRRQMMACSEYRRVF